MNKIVFDASAAIALINDEVGSKEVMNYLKKGIISTVNFAETLSILNRANITIAEGKAMVSNIFSDIVDFDEKQACIAAEFKKMSKKYGLSFGDCACLALGKLCNLAVVTADRAWKDIHVGVPVILIC